MSARARPGALQAVVTGRDRPTSLARFAAASTPKPGERTVAGNLRKNKGGAVSVTVKPGRRASIKRAFLIDLKGGNTGLAVRTEGPPPKGAYKPKQLGPNLWLLYGPSVNQVLFSAQSGGGVIEELQPEILYVLQTEFNRQMDLSK